MAETIDLVLPVKPGLRDDGQRMRICLTSLAQYLDCSRVGQLLIIIPDGVAKEAVQATTWSGRALPFATKILHDHEVLGLDPMRARIPGWFTQQLVKLGAADHLASEFYITLDSDVLLTRPTRYGDLIEGGRAATVFYGRQVHASWWRASAQILGMEVDWESDGMGVTPAILSTQLARGLLRHLASKCAGRWYRPIVEFLDDQRARGLYAPAQGSSVPTEYTLYYLFAELTGGAARYHTKSNSLWCEQQIFSREELEQLPVHLKSAAAGCGRFLVLQSTLGLTPEQVWRAVAPALRLAEERSTVGTADLSQPGTRRLRSAHMAPKFVFSGTGTRGDLLPMFALASELQRRGHGCHVLANEPSGELARKFGVPFTSTAPAQVNNLTGTEAAFGNHVFPSYRPSFELIEAELAGGRELIIVNNEYYAGSTLMAERHQLPLCRLTLAPFRIFSMEQPFYPLSEKLRGPFAHTYRRYVLPRMREQRYGHPYVLSRLNTFRAELGLSPVATMRELDRLVSLQLCMFPEWYCPPAVDWPQPLACVGFPLPPAHGELPEELAQFIGRHGAPIVFTPGTGVVDVAAFFAAARECCVQLQRPGVFLSPHAPPPDGAAGVPLYSTGYLELALLLPSAALLVHHGGIGTTARALEAGIPQLISPQAFDQPDNGDRVSRLGVGSMILRQKLTGAALAAAAHHLLESSEVRAALHSVSRRVRASDSVALAADMMERQFIERSLPLSPALGGVITPLSRSSSPRAA